MPQKHKSKNQQKFKSKPKENDHRKNAFKKEKSGNQHDVNHLFDDDIIFNA